MCGKHPHIPGEKQLDGKLSGVSGEHQVEHEPATCPCSKEAKVNLDCIRHSVASRSRGVILPLGTCVHAGSWMQQRHGHTVECNKWPQRWCRDWSISPMKRGWESWDCSDLRKVGSGGFYPCTWTPEGNAWRGQSWDLQWCPVKRHQEVGTNTEVSSECQETSFHAVTMTKHWHAWPRELVKSPSLEILKTQLGTILSHWLWVALLKQGYWPRQLPEVTSNQLFCVSVTISSYINIYMLIFNWFHLFFLFLFHIL